MQVHVLRRLRNLWLVTCGLSHYLSGERRAHTGFWWTEKWVGSKPTGVLSVDYFLLFNKFGNHRIHRHAMSARWLPSLMMLFLFLNCCNYHWSLTRISIKRSRRRKYQKGKNNVRLSKLNCFLEAQDKDDADSGTAVVSFRIEWVSLFVEKTTNNSWPFSSINEEEKCLGY